MATPPPISTLPQTMSIPTQNDPNNSNNTGGTAQQPQTTSPGTTSTGTTSPGTTSTGTSNQGLHDIKPIPEFHPLPILLICILSAAILGAIYYLYRKHKSNRLKPEPTLPPEPPYTLVLRRIEYLSASRNDKTISVRELALQLSLALREYLERTLNFPAVEQTGQEVISHLKVALKGLHIDADTTSEEIFKCIDSVFRFVERASFCEEPDVIYPLLSKHFDDAFSHTRDSVEKIEHAVQTAIYRTKNEQIHTTKQNDELPPINVEQTTTNQSAQTVDETA